MTIVLSNNAVVEAYRLDRYDNISSACGRCPVASVVEAYRLDRYDNAEVVIKT